MRAGYHAGHRRSNERQTHSENQRELTESFHPVLSLLIVQRFSSNSSHYLLFEPARAGDERRALCDLL